MVVARGAKRVKSKGTTRAPRLPPRLCWALRMREASRVGMVVWRGGVGEEMGSGGGGAKVFLPPAG